MAAKATDEKPAKKPVRKRTTPNTPPEPPATPTAPEQAPAPMTLEPGMAEIPGALFQGLIDDYQAMPAVKRYLELVKASAANNAKARRHGA